jgi:uncharacterized protein YbjT (DUF2867 family)
MEKKRVLLTGATGYIGRRLMIRLAADPGVELRLFVRNAAKLGPLPTAEIEAAEGSTFDFPSLAAALTSVDTAYYLIHSLGAGRGFQDLERKSAENFREACIAAGVGRIIYLGGLGTKETGSEHLKSRIETGEILSARPDRVQTIWFRAGIIIGSGSASFEIVRDLVQKLPVMTTPRWVSTRTEPIAVDDVLGYLQAALKLETEGNVVVDIGAGAMSFRQMLLKAARLMNLRRWIIPVPFFSPHLSSYWLVLITPVPSNIARALVDGLKSETVVLNDNARIHFGDIHPVPFETAFSRALTDIETNQVLSRWCDSSAKGTCDIRGEELPSHAVFRDTREFDFADTPSDAVFRAVVAIGGDRGWLAFPWLWQLRGLADKVLGGPGLNRGRRDPANLRVGDSLDFWKVLDLRPGQRLLLAAQMKVPGNAWLEFGISGGRLIQTAHFLPQGLGGRLYWSAMKPFHALIFRGLAKKIIAQARAERPPQGKKKEEDRS